MNNSTTYDMLYATCRRIAEELHACVNGEAYVDDDGKLVVSAEERADLHQASVSDYLDDMLDATATVSMDGDVRSVRVAMCLGGPNVYIDTAQGAVVGYWGSDEARAALNREAVDEVEECVTFALRGAANGMWS